MDYSVNSSVIFERQQKSPFHTVSYRDTSHRLHTLITHLHLADAFILSARTYNIHEVISAPCKSLWIRASAERLLHAPRPTFGFRSASQCFYHVLFCSNDRASPPSWPFSRPPTTERHGALITAVRLLFSSALLDVVPGGAIVHGYHFGLSASDAHTHRHKVSHTQSLRHERTPADTHMHVVHTDTHRQKVSHTQVLRHMHAHTQTHPPTDIRYHMQSLRHMSHTHTDTHMHAHIHTCTHTHSHTNTRSQAHTNTHTHSLRLTRMHTQDGPCGGVCTVSFPRLRNENEITKAAHR